MIKSYLVHNILNKYVSVTPLCYLESIFAVYMVFRLNWCNDITWQRDATEHRFFSAVCETRTHTHTYKYKSTVTYIQNNT